MGKCVGTMLEKHSSSGEVPKVPQKDTRPRNSTAVERYSNTSDGQSAPSKVHRGKCVVTVLENTLAQEGLLKCR